MNTKSTVEKVRKRALFHSLIVMHSIATFNAEYITACCGTGPIEIPIILSANCLPITLFEIADQHRFVHISAIGDANPFNRCLRHDSK